MLVSKRSNRQSKRSWKKAIPTITHDCGTTSYLPLHLLLRGVVRAPTHHRGPSPVVELGWVEKSFFWYRWVIFPQRIAPRRQNRSWVLYQTFVKSLKLNIFPRKIFFRWSCVVSRCLWTYPRFSPPMIFCSYFGLYLYFHAVSMGACKFEACVYDFLLFLKWLYIIWMLPPRCKLRGPSGWNVDPFSISHSPLLISASMAMIASPLQSAALAAALQPPLPVLAAAATIHRPVTPPQKYSYKPPFA